MELASRQKRLLYWLTQFNNSNGKENGLSLVKEKLETYRLLLARLLKAKAQPDIDETLLRIQTLERELENHFENLRLKTSKTI